MEKRTMTWKLAETLLDALCCVAISADGGYDENETDCEGAQEYARKKFIEILEQWEQVYGFKWEIEEPTSTMIS